jgi:hypothetical protein
MKRMMMTIVAALMMAVQASAMSYTHAQREALFLTDKMAYELNLTQEQYDAAYEINLDYLMGVTSVDDVYSVYWTRRNLDLSYILLDWQWNAFRAASYFYRPLYWDGGYWHFGVYARYPRRTFFYFDRPGGYASYRGGHSWHSNGGHSYYHGRSDNFRRSDNQMGMRDRFDRGDFKGARTDGRSSSTRVTANRNNSTVGGSSSFGRARSGNSSTYGSGRTGGTFSSSRSTGNASTSTSTSASRAGTMRSSATGTGGTFSSSRTSTRTSTVPRTSSSTTRTAGTFAGQRATTATPSRSSGTTVRSQSGGSFGGQRSGSFSSSRSTSSPARSSVAPSRSSGGTSGGGASRGGSFGGRR